MPPWPLTLHDPVQFVFMSSCCGEESFPYFSFQKSDIWWKFIFMGHSKYQDLFPYPPHEDLDIEYDFYEWQEYCVDRGS